jgi:hypothetical protein
MLKIVDKQELLTPVFIRAYLRLAQTAFSQPQVIPCAPDKHPEVTLFLLDYLREKVTDGDLQRQIDSTKQYILNQTNANTASSARPPSKSRLIRRGLVVQGIFGAAGGGFTGFATAETCQALGAYNEQ